MEEPRRSGPFTFWWPDDPNYKTLAQRDNGNWYYREYIGSGGEEWRTRSYGTKDESAAKELHVASFGKVFVSAEVGRVRNDDVFEEFLVQMLADGGADTTNDRYRSSWKNDVKAIIGNKAVSETDRRDVQRVINLARAREKKARGSGTLGEGAVAFVHRMLQSFFSYCIGEGYRPDQVNPAKFEKRRRPKAPRSQVVGEDAIFSNEQIELIVAQVTRLAPNPRRWDAVAARKRELFVRLSPEVGTRISEFLGTDVADVDFVKKRLWINKQLRRNYKADDYTTWMKGLKGDPDKIGSRVRYVPLSDYALELLEDYIECGLADGWLSSEGLLLPSQKQTPTSLTLLSTHLRVAGEALGRPLHAHLFRHHYISTLLHAGVPIDRVAKYAGNSPKVINDVYRHWIDDDTVNEMDRNAVARSREERSNVIEFRRRAS